MGIAPSSSFTSVLLPSSFFYPYVPKAEGIVILVFTFIFVILILILITVFLLLLGGYRLNAVKVVYKRLQLAPAPSALSLFLKSDGFPANIRFL